MTCEVETEYESDYFLAYQGILVSSSSVFVLGFERFSFNLDPPLKLNIRGNATETQEKSSGDKPVPTYSQPR